MGCWVPGALDASLCQILSKLGQSTAEILQFFYFSRWRLSAILDLFGTYLNHPHSLLLGLYHSAKFAWNRSSSFDNMKVLIFGAFGLKRPIHTPKIGVYGWLNPINAVEYQLTPNRHIIALSTSLSTSFEPRNTKICWRVWPVDKFSKRT